MENDMDLVVFQDDDGNELTMEVLDYFFYEGQEYALLADVQEEDACDSCEEESCDACGRQRDAYIMKVNPVGEDEEEFEPVDEALAEKLIEIVENEYDLDDEEFEEDEEDDE
ncbi:MAG: DUF1292 domain-containing protein [Eubacteriales bacterium]|nr:DUF1292 domain-containing protein [Eubacteriales bacterium]